MLSDSNFNAIAQQFAAFDQLMCRGQKLMNIMPPLSPTAMPAAYTCPCLWV